MPAQTPTRSTFRLSIAEIRGIAQLATEATEGVTDIAESVHRSVGITRLGSDRTQEKRTRGITGLVYRSVRGVTRMVGRVIDSVLAWAQPRFDTSVDSRAESIGREAILAALNGVMGDRLTATHNPLATYMTLRYRGEAIDWQTLSSITDRPAKVLVMIHGLCMNDLQWNAKHNGDEVDHAGTLEAELGYTPVYLRYNSGLHTSTNGRDLSALLERLVTNWPVAIEDLTVVGHSMGGLLIRSAFYYAKEEALRWPELLKNIVFLGTPHHGSPLERAGNWVDVILAKAPYTKPFARLGQLRSAGITDLRYGNILDDDWNDPYRFVRQPDSRTPVALPAGVNCFSVAATTASKRGALADRLTGDGLVPLNSALGQHPDPNRNLQFADDAQMIAYGTNHMALLASPDVTQQIVRWLTPATTTQSPRR